MADISAETADRGGAGIEIRSEPGSAGLLASVAEGLGQLFGNPAARHGAPPPRPGMQIEIDAGR